jgi:hypothetical protein
MMPPLSPQEERKRRALDDWRQRKWNREHGIEEPASPAVVVFMILFLIVLALFHPGAAAILAVLWVLSLQKDN